MPTRTGETIIPTIIRDAYSLLYPEKEFRYDPVLKYSRRFKPYNANVKLRGARLEFHLSRDWKTVSKEIQIGMIQELLLKLNHDKSHQGTMYVDLYNNFIKRVHIAIPKTKTDAVLEASFSRVNDKYFLGLVEQPNLSWGAPSRRKLGSYDFKSDLILISSIFTDLDSVLLDSVMYHEMLHKQNKFKKCRSRTQYHDKKFRDAERAFENFSHVEAQLQHAVRTWRPARGRRVPGQDVRDAMPADRWWNLRRLLGRNI